MKLENFFPYILPEVPGCPDPTIRLNLVMVAQDFCRESLSWTEIQDPITLIDGEPDYELDVPTGGAIGNVRDVWMGNSRLEPKTMAALQGALPNWSTAQSSAPIYYNQAINRGSIRLYPTPMNANSATIVVRAAYVPNVGADTVPDYLFTDYMRVIAAGTKAALMAMPGVGWSNPTLSTYYKAMYDDGVIKARVIELHDRVAGTVSVQPRTFGF